jgi:hypothetical protein
LVIDTGSRQLEQLRLLFDRQLVLTIDHGFPLGPSMRPSAPDKKSVFHGELADLGLQDP